jgi:hypothetical protein
MPNYSITVNSKFDPFSYQELLAPVQAETQMHKGIEEAYSALDAEAAQWDKVLDPERDSELYNMYTNYRSGIKTMADKLSSEGLYQNAPKDALALKTRYMQDIVPIKNAYDRWQADIKKQSDMKAQDPSRIFAVDAGNLSIQNYYNDQGLNASTANVSGELLRTQVEKTAKEYAKILRATGSLKSLGIDYQYTRNFYKGASVEELQRAILNDPKAKPILTNITRSVLSGAGIDNWSQDKYNQAYNIASTGLYAALGETTHENLKDDLGIALEKKRSGQDTPVTSIGLETRNYFNTTDDYNNLRDNISNIGKKWGNTFKDASKKPSEVLYESSVAKINKNPVQYANYILGQGGGEDDVALLSSVGKLSPNTNDKKLNELIIKAQEAKTQYDNAKNMSDSNFSSFVSGVLAHNVAFPVLEKEALKAASDLKGYLSTNPEAIMELGGASYVTPFSKEELQLIQDWENQNEGNVYTSEDFMRYATNRLNDEGENWLEVRANINPSDYAGATSRVMNTVVSRVATFLEVKDNGDTENLDMDERPDYKNYTFLGNPTYSKDPDYTYLEFKDKEGKKHTYKVPNNQMPLEYIQTQLPYPSRSNYRNREAYNRDYAEVARRNQAAGAAYLTHTTDMKPADSNKQAVYIEE